jgi:hemerythrin
MVIVWKEELATGYELIDDQHKELFRRFNNFQSACKTGKGLEELTSLLTFLGDYIRSHLEMEEQLQIEHNYPDYVKHKQQHDEFRHKFNALEDQLNSAGATRQLLVRTNFVLADWLIRHFVWTDSELAIFLLTTIPGNPESKDANC